MTSKKEVLLKIEWVIGVPEPTVTVSRTEDPDPGDAGWASVLNRKFLCIDRAPGGSWQGAPTIAYSVDTLRRCNAVRSRQGCEICEEISGSGHW
jgi:hypothetical protein